MQKIILLFFMSVMFSGCDVVKFWQIDNPDNFIEELAEEYIEEKTGINVDLTPITGEESQSIDIFKKEF